MVGFKFLFFGRYFRFNSGPFRFNFTFLIYYYLRHLLLLYSYVVYAGLYIHTTLEDLGFVDNIVILDSGITTAIRHVTVLRENGSTVGLNKHKLSQDQSLVHLQSYKQKRDCLVHFLRLLAVCWPGAQSLSSFCCRMLNGR